MPFVNNPGFEAWFHWSSGVYKPFNDQNMVSFINFLGILNIIK